MKLCPQCAVEYEQGHFCPRDGSRLEDTAASESPTTTVDPAREWIDKVIADRFRVVKLVGQGGMGTVYEARHLYIDKRVALKLLRPEITASSEAVERFQREAMAASTIGHDNIVRIDDFGRLPDGQVYLTMEYLEGEPLSRVLAREVLPVSEILRIACQICDGLAAAHDKGIIHRDIKAENVFLRDSDGRVAILDFGIAKISGSGGQSNLTQTGAIFGTPNYMSPEQALGKPVDCRTDMYSVGVMVYEMLTGTVPFEADSFMGVLTRHLTEEPLAPSARVPERWVPGQLEAVVLRAMAKRPEDRFSDMRAFADALRQVEQDLDYPQQDELAMGPPRLAPTVVRAGSITATAGELVRTSGEAILPSRRRWVLGGIVGVAVVAVGAWMLLYWGQMLGDIGSERRPTGPMIARSAAGGDATTAQADRDGGGRPAPLVTPEQQIRVVIASIPSGAEISRDGARVGETPEVLSFRKGEPVVLRLQAAGYQQRELTIDAKKDRKLTVRLEPEAAPKPEADKPKRSRSVRAKKSRRGRSSRRARRDRDTADSDHGSDHEVEGGSAPSRTVRRRRFGATGSNVDEGYRQDGHDN